MAQTHTPHIAVIGGGPAGLMAAEVIAGAGLAVTVHDRMAATGRKFLLAGRGGLNLTHNEAFEALMARYGGAAPRLRAAIEAFPPARIRDWCHDLGQPTFVGSSGRVFPVAMKASPLLRAWLRRLAASGVRFRPRHLWNGWDEDGRLRFATPDGPVTVEANATVLAMGGASWPRLGSDGAWTGPLAQRDIAITPLKPANCGFLVPWSAVFRERFHGQPLKGVGLSFGSRSLRGEALITRDGLEGGGVYALSGILRDAIEAGGEAMLHIDLRPGVEAVELAGRLGAPRGKRSLANFLRKAAKLTALETGLLREAALARTEPLGAMTPDALARLIKAVRVRLIAAAPLARAISTAGGLGLGELDDHFMLKAIPGTFAAGEMLDWEAPTGGYLLQACFATGAAAGRGVIEWLKRPG